MKSFLSQSTDNMISMKNDDLVLYNPIAHLLTDDLRPLVFSTMFLALPENIEIAKKIRDKYSINLPINLMSRNFYLAEKGFLKPDFVKALTRQIFEYLAETEYMHKFVGKNIISKFPEDFKPPRKPSKAKSRKRKPNVLKEFVRIIACFTIEGKILTVDDYFTSNRINDSISYESIYRMIANQTGATITDKEIRQIYDMQTKTEKSRKYNDKYIARDTYYLLLRQLYPDFTYLQLAEYLWEEFPEIYGFDDYDAFLNINDEDSARYEKELVKFSKKIEKSLNRLKQWIIDICDSKP